MARFSQVMVSIGMLLAMEAISFGSASAQELDGKKLLAARCAACHARAAEGGMNRISQARKTPEGWDMTIARMMLIHGVQVTADERRALVKYLADTQGLAPAETKDWRYILERRPNVVETPPDEKLAVMCARCHSYARIALQRRDAGDWLKLSHFHLGQWPTIEYQALGRDRNWWEIASAEVPKRLAELYPFRTPAWDAWQTQQKADVSGRWRLIAHRPGVGDYQGTATIQATGDDHYSLRVDLSAADGSKVQGEGSAIVYTGYEWRARLNVDGEPVLQILALSEDGSRMSGRWFLEHSNVIGGRVQAVRMGQGAATVLAVQPPYLKNGESAKLAIHGVGLDGEVSLGEGVEITETLARSPETVVVQAKAAPAAESGARSVAIGAIQAPGLLTVYRQVDSVRVEPELAIARVGDNGGPIPPVSAQFDAVAYLNGPDGKPGTDDDVRIGVMPATWSVSDFNEEAAAMQDAKYAGSLQETGLFMPAAAGPNPERRYQTNNAGDLAVKAVIKDGGSTREGSAHLIVTVQRWNDPPIH